MNIAVLGIRGLPANYSGFETCADHTTKYWSQKNNSVIVYCRTNRYKERLEEYNGSKLIYITQLNGVGLETLSHTFFSIIHLCLFKRSYRLVHLYNVGNSIFIPLLKVFGKKVIVSVDGIEWKRDKWGRVAKNIYRIGEKLAIKWADRIIVDNKEIEKYYQSNFNKETHLIAYGSKIISPDKNSSETTLSNLNLERKKYLLFVGRLVPEKGAHNLIDAYKKIKTDYPLVIIGDDHSNSEYKQKLKSEASDKVRFLGFKYGEEYEQILANALVYVSASHLEGTSPSLLAAMGAKVCCLVNGIPENTYTTQGCAFTFKENDFESLRSMLDTILADLQQIEAMAEKGYHLVKKEYQWEKIADDYIQTFQLIQ